jgi:hypothetical protein
MEQGHLHVCTQIEEGGYLWELYNLNSQQWLRVCKLLQQAGIENSILWDSVKTLAMVTDFQYWIGIEYLWTDLEVVHRGFSKIIQYDEAVPLTDRLRSSDGDYSCIAEELGRQQAWVEGPRRAWLAACVHVSILS